MSRRDKQNDKQQRRHLDDLDKGVRRGDAALATTALMALPPEQRTPHLPAVAAALARATHAGRGRGSLVPLHPLAVQSCTEPRLFDAAGEAGREAAWTLAWACVGAHDWPRAATLMALALPTLAQADDGASRALREFLAAKGAPDAATFAATLPAALRAELSAAAPVAVALPPPAAPTRVDDVDAAVLAAFTGQSAHDAAALTAGWAAQADAALRPAIVATAARQLALALLPQSGRRGGPIASVLDALARLARVAPLPDDVVLPVIRLYNDGLGAALRLDLPPPPGLASATALCAASKALVSLPLRWLERGAPSLRTGGYDDDDAEDRCPEPGWLAIARTICESSDDAAPIWWALSLWNLRIRTGESTIPSWLQDAVASRLRAGPTVNWQCWRDLPDIVRDSALSAVKVGLPRAMAADVIDACAPLFDVFERNELADIAVTLVEHASVVGVPTQLPIPAAAMRDTAAAVRTMLHGGDTDFEVYAFLRDCGVPSSVVTQLIDANRPILEGGVVSSDGRELWRRFAPWMVPLDLDHFDRHIRIAKDPAEAAQGLAWWFDANDDRDAFDDAMMLWDERFGREQGEPERQLQATMRATARRCALLVLDRYADDGRGAIVIQKRLALATHYLALLDEAVGEPSPQMLEARKIALKWRESALKSPPPKSKSKPTPKLPKRTKPAPGGGPKQGELL